MDHRYLNEELDVVVLSEACRFANEIITMGKGTKDIVEGSWPRNLTHHKLTKREDWVPFVRDNATTCMLSPPLPFNHLNNTNKQATTQEEPAKWGLPRTPWPSWIPNFACVA